MEETASKTSRDCEKKEQKVGAHLKSPIQIENAIFEFLEDLEATLYSVARANDLSPMDITLYAREIYGEQEWARMITRRSYHKSELRKQL